MEITSRRNLIAALALGAALALPSGASAQKKYTFGYDQPHTTAYGIAGDIFNAKLMEFARINTGAAFAYAQELSRVKSPAEFMELTTKYAREQFETMTEQAKELAALAQKMTLDAADPLKSRTTRAFS